MVERQSYTEEVEIGALKMQVEKEKVDFESESNQFGRELDEDRRRQVEIGALKMQVEKEKVDFESESNQFGRELDEDRRRQASLRIRSNRAARREAREAPIAFTEEESPLPRNTARDEAGGLSAGHLAAVQECSWVAALDRTLELRLATTRGWGTRFEDAWGQIASLHLLAALTGRHLVLHQSAKSSYLPTDVFALNGNVSWGTSGEEAAEGLKQAHVVDEIPGTAQLWAKRPLGLFSEVTATRKAAQRESRNYSCAVTRQVLQGISSLSSPRVWLNTSRPEVAFLLSQSLGERGHMPDLLTCANQHAAVPVIWRSFQSCVKCLATTPKIDSKFVEWTAATRRSLGSTDYIGVHARTTVADMKLSRGGKHITDMRMSRANATIAFVSWNSAIDVRRAITTLCGQQKPLYVASDSKALMVVFEELCPTRVHGATCGAREKGVAGGRMAHCAIVDWLMLAAAPTRVQLLAPSSFVESSASRGACERRARGRGRVLRFGDGQSSEQGKQLIRLQQSACATVQLNTAHLEARACKSSKKEQGGVSAVCAVCASRSIAKQGALERLAAAYPSAAAESPCADATAHECITRIATAFLYN